MINIGIELSKYIICLLMVLYALYSFTVFRYSDQEKKKWIFRKQNLIMFTIHAICYGILYLTIDKDTLADNVKIPIFYLAQVFLFVCTIIVYKLMYKRLSRLVLNHMLMLTMISFVMLTRLSYEKAVKQFLYVGIGLILCTIVPVIIRKIKYLKDFGWFYGIAGLVLLLIVFVIGKEQYGAKNWIFIGGFSFQPSEFVKIVFVFFVAALLSKAKNFRDIAIVSVVAGCHVIVLVLEKDLGGALIYFITFLMMLFIATLNPLYLVAGLGGGSVASILAYRLFSHVRVRVTAWQDPWSVIDSQGYQITQSLFAIGAGGWFGMGLTKGLPTSIPVVDTDFIFSAIVEEFGGIFAICLILIYISCFIMFINISMKMSREFYRLIALGLSVVYMFQLFLVLGGVTKFIPSTGVTLPLISAGGSSVLSTLILFNIIQGLYVLNQDEMEEQLVATKEAVTQEVPITKKRKPLKVPVFDEVESHTADSSKVYAKPGKVSGHEKVYAQPARVTAKEQAEMRKSKANRRKR